MLTGDRSAATNPPTDPYQPSAVLTWQQDLASVLVAGGTDTAVVVPDSRLDGILSSLAGAGVPVHQLTREEECVAFAAGHRVCGRRPALFMQCSGLGNAANALGSLAIPYGLSVPLVISMRGTLGERNPAQVAMGQATVPLLTSLGIQSFPIRSETEVEPITRGVLALCFEGGCPAAILLELELGGGRDERG